MIFEDRFDAGRKLAERLTDLKGEDVLVLALPRGGVEVGYEIARALEAPLGLIITRKVGHPMNPEVAVCAVAEEGDMICNELVQRVDRAWLQRAAAEEREEARRRRLAYKPHTPDISPEGKTVILTDDGVATGLTMMAALRALKAQKPARLILALPVAPPDFIASAKGEADELIVLTGQEGYAGAVGAYYRRFAQTSDEEVVRLLRDANSRWLEPAQG